MVNPGELVREIKQLHHEGMMLDSIVHVLSVKHNVRDYDVRVIAVTNVKEFYDEWEPGMRRKVK